MEIRRLLKQYYKLFKYEDVDLEFTPDAIRAVAKRSIDRKTGARGLRSIMEDVLLECMYELPSMSDAVKVIVDESVIYGESSPLIVHKTSDDTQTETQQTVNE